MSTENMKAKIFSHGCLNPGIYIQTQPVEQSLFYSPASLAPKAGLLEDSDNHLIYEQPHNCSSFQEDTSASA